MPRNKRVQSKKKKPETKPRDYWKVSELFSNVWKEETCIPFYMELLTDHKQELALKKVWQNHVLWKSFPPALYQISDLKLQFS